MDNSQGKKLFGLADIAIITACLFWGLGAVVVKSAIGDTPETFRIFVFNGIRMPAASLLLFGAARLRGNSLRLRREHIPLIIAITFFGIFLNLVTCLTGLYLSSASNMGIIYATAPFAILLLSFFTGIERPSRSLVLGIIIGMNGVLALVIQDGKIRLNPGDVLIFISVIFWAVYVVYGKKILSLYAPLVATACVFFFASIFQLPLFFFQLPHQTWSTISPANWINLVIGTIGSYFISNSLFFYAIKHLGTIRVGLYGNLEPVFVIILAYFIRGETITLLKIAGFVIIFIGICITKFPYHVKLLENSKQTGTS